MRAQILFCVIALGAAQLACAVKSPDPTPVQTVTVQTPPPYVTESQNASGSPVARFAENSVSNYAETPEPIVARCSVLTGIDAGALNLRACAGVACAVIGTLSEGETVTVITPGEWLEVRTGSNMTGFINSQFCK